MEAVLIEGSVSLARAGVDGLLSDDLTGLSAAGVLDLVRAVETLRCRLDAVDHRLLSEVAERSLAGELGRCSTADFLTSELRVSPGVAKRRVRHATNMGPRRALSGERLEPIFPAVAAAQAEGAISAAHAGVITDCVTALSPMVGPGASEIAEHTLVGAARHENPSLLRRTAAELTARLDPDGIEPAEDRAARRRHFSLHPTGDGTFAPTGQLTGEAAAVWQTILNALAAPRPAEDGTADDRSAAQRRHDALLDAGLRLLRSGTLPDSGGVPVTVLARTTLTDLAAMADHRAGDADTNADAAERAGRPDGGSPGLAVTEHGDLISLRALLELGCEADLVTVALDDLGGVLNFGTTRRLATPGQRRALAARDGGCCFPGCDRPPSWAETHHVIEWINLGPTDIDNLCLLCPHHHRAFEPLGWKVRMTDGRPEWIPPPWLDSSRRPRRNTAHHLDDIHFGDIRLADLAVTATR